MHCKCVIHICKSLDLPLCVLALPLFQSMQSKLGFSVCLFRYVLPWPIQDCMGPLVCSHIHSFILELSVASSRQLFPPSLGQSCS